MAIDRRQADATADTGSAQPPIDLPPRSISTTSNRGVLLVGHGTRDPRGVAEYFAVCRRVADKLGPIAVEPCFLELCEPPIPTGISRLLDAGARHVVVAPLLLFAAGHAHHDIPQAVSGALRQFPEVRWVQSRHLGCQPAILQQSAIRFDDAVAGRPPLPRELTLLLLVGRGSRDEQATREACAFAEATTQSGNVGRTLVCFYAMARPPLVESLESAAKAGFHRIIVQPHLLFHGQIADAIREQVQSVAERTPHIEWIVTEPLGPTDLVAQAVANAIYQHWPNAATW